MSREILTALAGGLAGAVLYLSVRTGTPGSILLAYLSPLPLLFAGLSAGWIWAGAAGVTALAGIAAGASPGSAAMFAVVIVIPVLIVSRQGLLSRPGTAAGAMEWYPPGLLLGWLTGYGLAGLVVVAVWLSGREGGLEGVIGRYLSEALRVLAPEARDPRIGEMLRAAARYVPGLMISVWLAVIVANAALAQGLLVRMGRNRRPSPAWSELELPRWLLGALVLAALASLMSGQIGTVGRNGLMIAAVPYLLLGLSVVHVLARRWPGRGFILTAVYLVLMLFVWPAILILGLGIVEQWVQLRRRFAGPTDDQEDV